MAVRRRSRSRSEACCKAPITNHERVGNALDLLKGGLAASVEREFTRIYKDRAFAEPT